MVASQTQAGQTQAGQTHEGHVQAQFGARAGAYVESAVHARGPDLDALAGMLAGQSGARLLDLGCGGGHVAYTAAPLVREVVAYDLSAEMLAAVEAAARTRGLANIRTERGAAERLPFPDASFDWVATRFSAHHWTDMPAGVAQMARVLRPGGRAVLIDTVAPDSPKGDSFLQAIEMLRDPSHVRNYRAAEWRAAAAAAGLAVAWAGMHRLPLDFATWIARMRTPAPAAQAIRDLQAAMPAEVRAMFDVAEDGSFTIDVLTLHLIHERDS